MNENCGHLSLAFYGKVVTLVTGNRKCSFEQVAAIN
jgi:hypothetical protein